LEKERSDALEMATEKTEKGKTEKKNEEK